MTSWIAKNIGATITLVVILSGIVASWAVAQYQISELRNDHQHVKHDNDTARQDITEIKADIRWIRSAVERLEKGK